MRHLEIRRHSIRGAHGVMLNQRGVNLARRIGAGMGVYARVYASPAERAIQTALAMGFAVDEVHALLAIPESDDVQDDFDAVVSFQSAVNALARSPALSRYAARLRDAAHEIVAALPEHGDALLLSHGGVVEAWTAACAPDFDFRRWGGGVDFCEGARLAFLGGRCVDVKVLRLLQSPPHHDPPAS